MLKPRSDWGVIVLHWAVAALLALSLVTGMRIGADLESRVWLRSISSILPQGVVWPYHLLSGLALIMSSLAYGVYSWRSGLSRHIAINKTRLTGLGRGGRARWWSLHVIMVWALFVVMITQLWTGLSLYYGAGGWLELHFMGALALVAYPVAHVVVHWGIGGWNQLLRIFRPIWRRQHDEESASIGRAVLVNAAPAATAAALALTLGMVAYPFATNTYDKLRIAKISPEEAPKLDGDASDPVWQKATPVKIHTIQGANFGDGSTTVEIRAVHDGKNAYFAFTWDDPTRSLKHLPLVKKEDGWHLVHEQYDIEDEDNYYEDKFAVMFTPSADPGGGTSHLGPHPLAGYPAAYSGRGLHYTTDGSYADIWHWKAARGGMLGYIDDNAFGPPTDPKPDEVDAKTRYKAGYVTDPGKAFYKNNFAHEAAGGYKGPLKLERLPKDAAATGTAMGKFDLTVGTSEDDGSRWWMTEAETVPYSQEADEKIPVGTVIPGILIMGSYEGDRADVHAGAHWSNGKWTLEAQRAMDTGSKFDQPMVSGLYMFVSAFDHSQTRHTRHMRPAVLDVEN